MNTKENNTQLPQSSVITSAKRYLYMVDNGFGGGFLAKTEKRYSSPEEAKADLLKNNWRVYINSEVAE